MRVIIESPYAGDIKTNTRYLQAAMRDSVLRGESPYASHGLLTQEGVLDDNDPVERDIGIKAGQRWLVVADIVVVYTDLGISSGMAMGIEAANNIKKPVVLRTLPNWFKS